MAPAVMGGATRSRSRGRPQLLLIGLVVLVAVSLLLALRSSLQSQPAEPTVRVSPSSVEAGVAVTLTVTPVLHTLRLQPVGGGEAIPLIVHDGEASTIVTLDAGQYQLVDSWGARMGQLLTAAETWPRRPLALEEGAVMSLRSTNFPSRLLYARPHSVTTEEYAYAAANARKGGADSGTCFLVRDASYRCTDAELEPYRHAASVATNDGGAHVDAPRVLLLESCANGGLILSHGLTDGMPMRLVLPPLLSGNEAHACPPSVLFLLRSPSFAASTDSSFSNSVSLIAASSLAPSSMLVARHSFSKLIVSATSAKHVDPLLAADSSWTLAPPVDPSCNSRVRLPRSYVTDVAATARAEARVAAMALAALAAPSHRATLSVTIGGEATGSLTVDLFGGLAPQTVDNFVRLCRGTPAGREYKGTRINRVIPGFMAQGGATDSAYGESAWGGKFGDETFALSHDARGVLSMANAGPDTNGSQFFVLFGPQHHLDGKHVVFGKLVSAEDDGGASEAVLRAVEAVGSTSGETRVEVRIATCQASKLE